jgi:hypothetical protein
VVPSTHGTQRPVEICEYLDSNKMDIHAESLRHVTRADGSLANWFDEV